MAIKNIRGIGTLLSMIGGAGYGAAMSEEEENVIEDAATASFTTGAGMTGLAAAAKQVAGYSGMKMDNFSEGAYDAEPIKPKTLVGKAVRQFSDKPMLVSTAENWAQNVPSSRHTFLKLQDTLRKWENRPELGADYEGIERNAHYEFDRYKNWGGNNQNYNATPEEYRWKVETDGRRALARKLDRDITSRQRLLDGTIMSGQARAKLIADQRKAIYQYKRVGEAERKYRHEIAKNEVQALTWGKKWNRERLRKAGYAYKGMYRWKDVKDFLPKESATAWENNMALGQRIRTLHSNRTIPVLFNIHKGDKQIIGKMATRNHRWLQRASHKIASYEIENASQLRKWIARELPNDSTFMLSRRDVELANKWYKGLSPHYKKVYGVLENDIDRYAGKMSYDMQKAGAFRTNAKTGLRGYMTLNSAKNQGVSTLYLEGGVNINADIRPYMQGNKLQVASRIVKTDFQDLAKSAELGLQERPPVIINQSYQTYNPEQVIKTKVKGKTVYMSTPEATIGRNVTKANPFYGKYNWDLDVLGKQLNEGQIRDLWQGDKSLKRKIRGTTKAIKKNPRKALKYATRAPLPKAIKAIAVGGAALTGLKAMTDDDKDEYPLK